MDRKLPDRAMNDCRLKIGGLGLRAWEFTVLGVRGVEFWALGVGLEFAEPYCQRFASSCLIPQAIITS